jgi:hypothetical protein
MNIHNINSTSGGSHVVKTTKANPQPAIRESKDYQNYRGAEPDLSQAARLLSRNQAALHDALAPRAEVLKQYAAAINEPVKLNDRSIDRILHNMQYV